MVRKVKRVSRFGYILILPVSRITFLLFIIVPLSLTVEFNRLNVFRKYVRQTMNVCDICGVKKMNIKLENYCRNSDEKIRRNVRQGIFEMRKIKLR